MCPLRKRLTFYFEDTPEVIDMSTLFPVPKDSDWHIENRETSINKTWSSSQLFVSITATSFFFIKTDSSDLLPQISFQLCWSPTLVCMHQGCKFHLYQREYLMELMKKRQERANQKSKPLEIETRGNRFKFLTSFRTQLLTLAFMV